MSDDTPTQRFDATPVAPTAEKKSRRPIVILSIVGGVLLLALIVVLALLLTRGGDAAPAASPTPSATPSASASPSESPSPSATPSPSETTEPAPPPPPPAPSTDPAVDSFTINPTTVDCTGVTSVVITLQWATSNANAIYFGVDTGDASQAPFFGDSLPASGTSTNDFPEGYRPFEYTCGNGSHKYTITAVSADGTITDSASVTVTG